MLLYIGRNKLANFLWKKYYAVKAIDFCFKNVHLPPRRGFHLLSPAYTIQYKNYRLKSDTNTHALDHIQRT